MKKAVNMALLRIAVTSDSEKKISVVSVTYQEASQRHECQPTVEECWEK